LFHLLQRFQGCDEILLRREGGRRRRRKGRKEGGIALKGGFGVVGRRWLGE
jgi:hypothetical protein